MACCILGLFSLTQCGGSSSDAKGNAPESNNNTTMSVQTGIIDTDLSNIPNIFEATVTGSSQQLTTKAGVVNIWNSSPLIIYIKTDADKASLSISWVQGPSNPATTHYTLSIPDLTFDSSYHAVSGDQGAIISYRPANAGEVSLPATTADVTVTYL